MMEYYSSQEKNNIKGFAAAMGFRVILPVLLLLIVSGIIFPVWAEPVSKDVAVSFPYPDENEEKEIIQGNDSGKPVVDMEKVKDDLRRISKILPKNAKVLEAVVDNESVRYMLDGSNQYEKDIDLLEVLLELTGKMEKLNYPEFVHIYEACILKPWTAEEKYLLHLYLIYESKSDEVIKKEKTPLTLSKQMDFLKKIRSLAVPNIKIGYIRFSEDKREIEIHSITKPGLLNPNSAINNFKNGIARWISDSNISLHIADPRFKMDYKLFTIRIKY